MYIYCILYSDDVCGKHLTKVESEFLCTCLLVLKKQLLCERQFVKEMFLYPFGPNAGFGACNELGISSLLSATNVPASGPKKAATVVPTVCRVRAKSWLR